MHELSLMVSVRDLALARAREHGAVAITAITLRVGQLSGVEPEALAFAFEVVMAGSIAAKARLRIDPVAALWSCVTCGAAVPSGGGVVADADAGAGHGAVEGPCPACGGRVRRLREGGELELASLDLTVP
jgi:hydrogenase nickel incorporation protein HypA/HybF